MQNKGKEVKTTQCVGEKGAKEWNYWQFSTLRVPNETQEEITQQRKTRLRL